MSTYVSVEISPDTTTRPVFTSVSQATRPVGSSAITASRTPSEIWSATLSGWPSVTDSDVKRYSLSVSTGVVIRRGRLAVGGRPARAQPVQGLDERVVDDRAARQIDRLGHVRHERVRRHHDVKLLLAPAQAVRQLEQQL